MPQTKMPEDVITSLCIISIAPFHRVAKFFTNGSTSSSLIGCALLDPAASSPVLNHPTHNPLLSAKCNPPTKGSRVHSMSFPGNRPSIPEKNNNMQKEQG
jgi:hypothetical protein